MHSAHYMYKAMDLFIVFIFFLFDRMCTQNVYNHCSIKSNSGIHRGATKLVCVCLPELNGYEGIYFLSVPHKFTDIITNNSSSDTMTTVPATAATGVAAIQNHIIQDFPYRAELSAAGRET